MSITVGVLALQGGFVEHITLLKKASRKLTSSSSHSTTISSHPTSHNAPPPPLPTFSFPQVRTPAQLSACDALIIPGGESTTMALVAAESGLLEPLRDFVKVQQKPTWGTCAGLILLSAEANSTKKGGQELIGGLSVRVHRNHFGRQIESFEADIHLPFLNTSSSPSSSASTSNGDDSSTNAGFPGVFIRAPVVEQVLTHQTSSSSSSSSPSLSSTTATDAVNGAASSPAGEVVPAVQVLARVPNRLGRMKGGVSLAQPKDDDGDIVAVRQGNVLGTSFHPELTSDERIHVWWLREILKLREGGAS